MIQAKKEVKARGGRAARISAILGENIGQKIKDFKQQVMIDNLDNSGVSFMLKGDYNEALCKRYEAVLKEKGEYLPYEGNPNFARAFEVYLYDGLIWSISSSCGGFEVFPKEDLDAVKAILAVNRYNLDNNPRAIAERYGIAY